MATVVNVLEAKTRFSELLRRIEEGEQIVIARAGKPIARMESYTPPARRLSEPLLPGLKLTDAGAYLEPLSDEEREEWETEHTADPLRHTTQRRHDP